MKQKVSVVVVTRNRAKTLQHCLGSLAAQTHDLYELVVVDNNSIDQTKIVVSNFSKSVNFPVKYFTEFCIGYPYVYNRGITEATGQYVAFIDDDCVAECHWYANILKVVSNIPNVTAILGQSDEYYNRNTIALSQSYIDEAGRIGAIKNNLVTDLEILDSKNIVYNKKFLLKHGISFDQNLLQYAQGASADCDIGMQIFLAGGVAVYNKHMRVWHKDQTSILVYFKKTIFTLKNHLIYEKKWKNIRLRMKTKRSLGKRIKVFLSFRDKYSVGKFKLLLIGLIVFITFLFIKTFRIILKSEVNKLKVVQIQN